MAFDFLVQPGPDVVGLELFVRLKLGFGNT